jgi:Bacteriophage baseplate protein W
MTDILGSGLAFPVQADHRGALALSRGEDDIAQAIGLILGTGPGERPMRPEFGCHVHDFIFESIDAALIGKMDAAIRAALQQWEPRIDVTEIDFDLSRADEGLLDITIGYRVRATSSDRNLVYPFYVIPFAGEVE